MLALLRNLTQAIMTFSEQIIEQKKNIYIQSEYRASIDVRLTWYIIYFPLIHLYVMYK